MIICASLDSHGTRIPAAALSLTLAGCLIGFARTPGTLQGFGSDLRGGLGDGHIVSAETFLLSYSRTTVPSRVREGVKAAAAGKLHTLYVRTDGTLWSVGNNQFGQLGDGTTLHRWEPTLVSTAVKAVAAGQGHSLFLKEEGTLWAVGNNGYGQLGDGTKIDRLAPVLVASSVAKIAAGRGQSYFVKTDGSLWGIGDNSSGQLGDGTAVDWSSPIQIATDVAEVAAGDRHCLFVKTDGSLWGLGSNGSGELGDGTNLSRNVPVRVVGGVSKVAAGGTSSYFVKTDRTLWAMGNNWEGNLGDGTTQNRATPIQVANDVVQISASAANALFIKVDGSLWGMGYNALGQLGNGTTWRYKTPTQSTTNAVMVVMGDSHTLLLKEDGSLWSMGGNDYGQLADGTADERWTPTGIADDVISAAAGSEFTLFVRSDGTLWATGANWSGELGDGTTMQRSRPVLISSGVASVVAARGGSHSLFVKTDGTLWGMGANDQGQLGIGARLGWGDDPYPHPIPQLIDTHVATAAAAGAHSMYLKTDGTLWAMGANGRGQLGNGTTTNQWRPVRIAQDVASISAGEYHSFFIKADETLWGMGENGTWALGTGDNSNRLTPVMVASHVAAVSAGFQHTLFVKTDCTLWAMGSNVLGEYDNGSFTSWGIWHPGQSSPSSTPFRIASNVAAAVAASSRSFFVTTDGTLWGMGENWNSQLGDGTTIRGSRYSAIKIASNVSAVVAGDYHTLFIGGSYAGAAPAIGMAGDIVISQDSTGSTSTLVVKDADTAADQLVLTTSCSNPELIPPANIVLGGSGTQRSLRVRPAPGRHGLATITVMVSDGALSAKRDILVNVGPPFGDPGMTTNPKGTSVEIGFSAQLSVSVILYPTVEWQRNGVLLAGAPTRVLTVNDVTPTDVGLYTAATTSRGTRTISAPAILGTTTTKKVSDGGREIQEDIHHPNGNVFDQVLLTGAAEAITADHELNQITRTSFIDVDGDIVQVEFSGPGTLSLVLDAASGPAKAEKYNQDNVSYMKGHAGIVIAGATEQTNVSVFSVGKATAVNQGLFKDGVSYDGIADLAFIAILSDDGKFGGVRAANATFFADKGHTGIYAPGVEFTGPVFVGDVSAFDQAKPVLVLGSAADVRITGGDLLQDNNQPVQVSGITQLQFRDGSDSHGNLLLAQPNRAVLMQNGQDVTARVVVDP